MRTNEEFIEGIFSKRDALIKKRKKRNSVIVSAVCAAVCITAVAGVVGAQKPEKVEEFYNDFMKFGSFAKEDEFTNADRSEEESTTALTEDVEYYPIVESYTKPTRPASEKESDDKIQQECFTNKPEVLTGVVTEAIEGVADGEMGFAPELPDSGGDSENAAEVQGTENKTMPSTEKIVDAAYNALSEEERQCFAKGSAVATVTRYADGTQIYEVSFTAVDSLKPSNVRHITVQLDSDLNMICIVDF